jgi:hypothetical protein
MFNNYLQNVITIPYKNAGKYTVTSKSKSARKSTKLLRLLTFSSREFR